MSHPKHLNKVLTTFEYYDSENITESRLSFRRAISEPQAHGLEDAFCTKVLYGMDRCATSYQQLLDHR